MRKKALVSNVIRSYHLFKVFLFRVTNYYLITTTEMANWRFDFLLFSWHYWWFHVTMWF